MDSSLPVPVLAHPRWRVNFRPSTYRREALSLVRLREVVQQNQVQLRGWYYPHISNRPEENSVGSNWIASWSQFADHIEYWRFYQSGQFVHYFVIEEAVNETWQKQLQAHLRSELPKGMQQGAPGFALSIDNFLFTVIEIFEFAARLAAREIYKDLLSISIKLEGVNNAELAWDGNRVQMNRYVCTVPALEYQSTFSAQELASSAKEKSLDCSYWFFERFGLFNPPRSIITTIQDNFLAGRW